MFNSLWGTHITNIPYENYDPPRYALRHDGTPQQAINRIPFGGSVSFVSTFQYGWFDGYGILKNDELKIVYNYHKDTAADGRPNWQSQLLHDEFIGQRIK
jgi:hypothetical protein